MVLFRCTTDDLKSLGLGQIISLLVVGTGIFSQYLSIDGIALPASQSTLNYLLLAFHVPLLARQRGQWVLEVDWWKYLILAIIDVEANYFVVKAYQYTSITSVMLIDCFTIPCVMLLSRLMFRTKYLLVHVIGVCVCLVGIGLLVLSDFLDDPASQPGDTAVRGDLLCLLAAFLYSVSNVGQEFLVKTHNRKEFLGMIGVFGFVVNLVQLLILERHELASLRGDGRDVFYIIGFAACLFAMYNLTSVFLRWRDSALFNLSLLTSDAFAILVGVVLFGENLSFLYFLSLACTISGLMIYNQKPLETGVAVLSEHTLLTDTEPSTAVEPSSIAIDTKWSSS